jgi:signal transduction histidine kinase
MAFEEIDVNALLASISEFHETIQAELNVFIEYGRMPVINGVAFQLRQVFENLISNSIKYRTPHSDVLIKITHEIIPGSQIADQGANAEKQYHRFSVSDNGIGFEQIHAQYIFELFQRLHPHDEYPGTGIGLAICRRIVQNHRGVIFAESSPGHGAIFHICLPL